MKKYYIAYRSEETVSWAIAETELDLKTADGIKSLIGKLANEVKSNVVLLFWKELDS